MKESSGSAGQDPRSRDSHRSREGQADTPASDAYSDTYITKEQAENASQQAASGNVLGHYRLDEKIGQGGMGAVYKATHLKLKKVVVVKILAPNVQQDAELIARFEREMEAIGKLDHTHIVRALDAGEIDGVRYLVMEYIDGTDISQRIREKGPLPVIQALAALRQAALGLEHAHAHGLVHRDVKPSNLLWSKTGQIKVLDLGLALLRDQSAEAGITRTGQVLGTPEYMAPEQWDSTSGVDQRVDLYGLGGVLVFMLTGQSPFGGETRRSLIQWMRAHLEERPPELALIRTDVPDDVEAIVQKLLAKQPNQRFASCGELVKALDVIISRLKKSSSTSPASASQIANPESVPPRQLLPSPLAPTALAATAHKDEDVPSESLRWSTTTLGLIAAGVVGALLVIGMIVWSVGPTKAPALTQEPSPVSPQPPLSSHSETTQPAPPVSSPPAVEAPSATPDSVVPLHERPVAEWVLSLGGAVILNDNSPTWITQSGQLPEGIFHIRAIDLTRCVTIKDADLAKLSACHDLESLQLNGTPISDAGLVALEQLQLLTRLELQDCPVTDQGMASVSKLTGLEVLRMSGVSLSDRGLDTLRRLRRLKVLSLSGAGITNFGLGTIADSYPELTQLLTERVSINDAGLMPLAKLRQLRTLNVSLAPVTDAAVESVARISSLAHLIVQGTQISPAGIRELRTALPLCQVYGGKFEPRRQTVARILSEGGRITLASHQPAPQTLANFEELPDEFSVQVISLQGVTTLTRNSLRQLLLNEVAELNLRDSSLDPGDLRLLGASSPFLTTLDLSGTTTSDRDLGAILQLKNLQRLDVSRTVMTKATITLLKKRLPPSCVVVADAGL